MKYCFLFSSFLFLSGLSAAVYYDNQLNIEGSFLYWRTLQEENTCDCGSDLLHTTWDKGYRLTIGYDFECNWNLNTSWTHYSFNKHNIRDDATSNWKIRLDEVDALLGHHFYFNQFVFTPSIGLKAARINNHLLGHFTTLQQATSGDVLVLTDFDDMKSFTGVGPQLNLGFEWALENGFSLFGNIAGSVLYGNIDVDSFRTDAYSDPGDILITNEFFKRIVCQAVTEFEIGAKWTVPISCGKLFTTKVAWGHHRYFNVSQVCDCSGLSFDGIEISASLSF